MGQNNGYRGRTLEELGKAFEKCKEEHGFSADMKILERIEEEWREWEKAEPHADSLQDLEYEDSFYLLPDSNFCVLVFLRAVFSGKIENNNYIGSYKRQIAVYPDCMYPGETEYIRRQGNKH